MPISEFALIDRYFAAQSLSRPRSDVILGIGDDCALLIPPRDQQLVVTTDTLVADIHFFANTNPTGLGHKALAVNLSDLAAMGAEPAWITLALTLPTADEDWLECFCRGLFTAAERYQVQLVGGDTTRGPTTVLTLQAHGFVPPGQALRRSGAQPGDRIYVTGTPGDAGLALAAALGQINIAPAHQGYLQQRLECPEPRIVQGMTLRGIASAAIDVSDGLVQDLGHLLRQSGVGACIEAEQLPLSPALSASLDREAAWQMALAGGDDYELCFTVPPGREAALAAVAASWSCPCTAIGVVTALSELRVHRADGSPFSLERTGYDHFR